MAKKPTRGKGQGQSTGKRSKQSAPARKRRSPVSAPPKGNARAAQAAPGRLPVIPVDQIGLSAVELAARAAQSLGIERKARYYAHVREAHSSEQAEDYVEAIADLHATAGKARVADLKRIFGVSHVTVSRTVGRLVRDGLALNLPGPSIGLTSAGLALAQSCAARHEVVLRFLRALGLDEESAQLDAEGIEHHVSPRTLELFERFAQGHFRPDPAR
jgi:DtxR family transcriptional regulator, manganese transport regulator